MFHVQKKWLLAALTVCVFHFAPVSALASEGEAEPDYDALIQQQQELLTKLEEQKNRKVQEEYLKQVKTLEQSQAELNQQLAQMKKQMEAYDSASAIEALATRFNGFENRLEEQQKEQSEVIQLLKTTAKQQEEQTFAAPKMALVNPGPSAASMIQDAKNGQSEAQVNFAYGENQIYKIYSKVGYLTDIRFQKGEQITFVGGGDTARWMIDTAQAGDTAHLYIKPIAPDSTTNLIVNTNRHTYQLIVISSDWYNPMVSWSYTSEEQLAGKLQKAKEEALYTEKELAVTSAAQLNFSYKVKGKKSWQPKMVFDDGRKTYLKFDRNRVLQNGALPVLFVKEAGKRELSLVNYRVKDDCFIVDKVFQEAELRLSEKDTVKIIAAR